MTTIPVSKWRPQVNSDECENKFAKLTHKTRKNQREKIFERVA